MERRAVDGGQLEGPGSAPRWAGRHRSPCSFPSGGVPAPAPPCVGESRRAWHWFHQLTHSMADTAPPEAAPEAAFLEGLEIVALLGGQRLRAAYVLLRRARELEQLLGHRRPSRRAHAMTTSRRAASAPTSSRSRSSGAATAIQSSGSTAPHGPQRRSGTTTCEIGGRPCCWSPRPGSPQRAARPRSSTVRHWPRWHALQHVPDDGDGRLDRAPADRRDAAETRPRRHRVLPGDR